MQPKVTRKTRTNKLTEQQIDFVVSRYNAGITQTQLAQEYGVSLSTIRRYLRQRRV